MARDLAIDLGTANTLVYQKQKGILFAEPTVLALNKETGAVLAMGEEAWRMIGRTGSSERRLPQSESPTVVCDFISSNSSGSSGPDFLST